MAAVVTSQYLCVTRNTRKIAIISIRTWRTYGSSGLWLSCCKRPSSAYNALPGTRPAKFSSAPIVGILVVQKKARASARSPQILYSNKSISWKRASRAITIAKAQVSRIDFTVFSVFNVVLLKTQSMTFKLRAFCGNRFSRNERLITKNRSILAFCPLKIINSAYVDPVFFNWENSSLITTRYNFLEQNSHVRGLYAG